MTELTPELVADLAFPQELHISPDGTNVVYTLMPRSHKDEHQTSSIWVVSLDGSRPPRQFTSGETYDHAPQWSPDGSQIAFLSDRAKRGTDQLYVIAADGGEARLLMPKDQKKGVGKFAWSPQGGQIAFTNVDEPDEEDERREKERDDPQVYGERLSYARLRLLSLATGEITTLVKDERHVVGFAWHPRSTEIAYVTQQTPDNESWGRDIRVERIAVAGGEAQPVCHFPGRIDALTWSYEGQTLLCVASTAGKLWQSSSALYAVSAQGGEPRRIAGGETNCILDVLQLQQEQRVVAYVAEGLESRFCRVDTATGAMTTLYPTSEMDRCADYDAGHLRALEGGKVALAVVRGTGSQPWEIWAGLLGDEPPALRQITFHQQYLTGMVWGSQEPFYWLASDGWELDGLLVRQPDVSKDRPLPMVVLVHGGPYGRYGQGFHLGWYGWAQWLALAGYAVLMINPRGGFGHGEWFAAAVRGDVGGADFGDVMSAVDAAVERGIADPERLGIGGWSQGGFMSAWAVTQTDRFKAAIAGAGPTDWGMMAMTSDIPDFEREMGESVPWDGLALHRYMKLSPVYFADKAKTPILILHGEKDARVPVSQAIGFHRALREYQVPCELVIYPREPHGIGERTHQIDLLKRVRTWFDRWLRP